MKNVYHIHPFYMKPILLAAFLSLCVSLVFSQEFINFKKERIKKTLLKDVKHKSVTSETDTSFIFLIRDTSVRPLDLVFHFDQSGKCDMVKKVFNCDSCYQKFLKSTLESLKSVKLDDHRYISRYSKKMMVETSIVDSTYSYIIRRTNWSRKEYNKMLGKE